MSTRIVLEGPQLEPLLAQVRDDYGSRAKIVSANKIRSGGLGGFFAKQRFELSFEVGDDVGDPAGTLLDLVDSREDRFEGGEDANPTPVEPAARREEEPADAGRSAPTVAPVRSGTRTVTPLAIPSLAVESAALPRASVVSIGMPLIGRS